MQKYQNNIVSSSGTPVISASISVTNYPSGTAATIYSDNGVTLAANPLTSDSLGNFSFYAADGRYSLSISGVNVSATTLTDILLEDPTNPNPISATTITATGTSTLAGINASKGSVVAPSVVDDFNFNSTNGKGVGINADGGGQLLMYNSGTPSGLIAGGGTYLKLDSGDGTGFRLQTFPSAYAGAVRMFVNGTERAQLTATALNVTGALSATGALTTNGLKEDSSGSLGIGGAPSGLESLRLLKNMTGSASSIGVYNVGTVQSDVTSGAWYYRTFASTQAATFTLPQLIHYSTVQGTIGAGSTVTTQIGFEANGTLTGATNNYGFYGALSYATGRYNFYAAGTAPNRFVGETLVIGAAGLGYGTGAGGTVTQATSRSTSVTINKPTGAITLFSTAGVPTWTTFTVNNSLVSVTDTVVLSLQSGATNAYLTSVINVANGSFTIAFATTGGVATDSPNINFAIIKGATA